MKVKYLQIVNFEKFKNKILTLGTNVEIANKINVSPSVISNWLGISKRPVNSNNIKKILDVYNELTPDELGVEEVEIELPDISARIRVLLNENNMTQNQLAEVVGFSSSLISQWLSGTKLPKIDEIIKIADYFDVSVDYICGISDIRNFDINEMSNVLESSEYFIKFLKDDTPSAIRNFMGEQFTAEYLEEKYFDLKDEVFGDVLLLPTLKAECDRIISYYTSPYYYSKYEDCINETDIKGQTQEQPIRYDIEKLAHQNISEALSKVFDEYVDIQLTKIYKEKFKDRYTGEKDDKQVTSELKQGTAGRFLKSK